jgi:hypothetical protein
VSNRTTHTPGPWKVDPSTAFNEALISARGVEIGLLYCSDGADDETELPGIANAEFIVRACNAHDELVAALQMVQRVVEWDGSLPRPDDVPDAYAMETQIKAALAKAEGR